MSKQPMWRDYPHLFANGEFKFAIGNKFTNLSVEMYFPQINKLAFGLLKNKVDVDDCTLLARPISDMTDEERRELKKVAEDETDWYLQNLKETGDKAREQNINQCLYLLSIGVYPFDQSDFELDGLEAVTKEDN